MSPNNNYRAGRDFEYKRRKQWIGSGYEVIRAAGSHGPFDLIAFKAGFPVVAIQCKRVEDATTGRRLIKAFGDSPPLPACQHFTQVMEVYVKEGRELLTVSI